MTNFLKNGTFLKVQEDLGLIIGYACVCKSDGEDYYDLAGDNIPEDAMLEAALDFAKGARVAKTMHKKGEEGEIGTVVFLFPMTTDIAKSLDIEVKQTGLLIAIQPDDPEEVQKVRDGIYTGFSIGGTRVEDEEVE